MTISDHDFARIQQFIFTAAGITLSDAKKALVVGRLGKRLRANRLGSFSDYLHLLGSGTASQEVQIAVDLLTTNETYFFREPQHFEVLRRILAAAASRPAPFRAWSAACSSGEEAYSMAMVLADTFEGRAWELLASDISTQMLGFARQGLYALTRTDLIPSAYLKRFCLRGRGRQEGSLRVVRELRDHLQLRQINLNEELPPLGGFDVIFLRNVLIYFNAETKRQVVARLSAQLKPGGHLFIGQSESLKGVCDALETISPAVYRKPVAAR